MYVWLTLLACHVAPDGAAESVSRLRVDVVARVEGPGQPAAWTARAAFNGKEEPALVPGTCRAATHDARGTPGAVEVNVAGAVAGALMWNARTGLWVASGPGSTRDPAWSIGDVVWNDGAAHVVEGAVRFGGVPQIERALREREGGVYLQWDAASADATEILSTGPAGAFRCATEEGHATLPWWVVPPKDGSVVLRSTRTRNQLVDGVLIHTRTTLERPIPLDQPSGTTAEEKAPRFLPYAPTGPRRITRARRGVVG